MKLRVTIWDTYYYAVIASFEGLQSVGGNDLRPFKVFTDVIVVVVVACSVSFVVSAYIPVCYDSRPACSHLHFRAKCTFMLVGRLSVLDDKLDKVSSLPGIFTKCMYMLLLGK